MADALEAAPFLTSLNGCNQYAAIRAGGMEDMQLQNTDLALWAVLFLERSASSLTNLSLKCSADPMSVLVCLCLYL